MVKKIWCVFYAVYNLFVQPRRLGHLSLAIPLWVGKMSTGDGYSHAREEMVSSTLQ